MSWIVFLLTCRCQSDFLYIQPTPWPIQQLTESKSAAWKHPLTAESEWSRAIATRNIQQPDKLQDFSGLTAAMDTSECLKSSCQNSCFVLFVKRWESTPVHVLTIIYIWLYTFVCGPTCCMSMSPLESHITSQWKVFLLKKVMDNPTGIQIWIYSAYDFYAYDGYLSTQIQVLPTPMNRRANENPYTTIECTAFLLMPHIVGKLPFLWIDWWVPFKDTVTTAGTINVCQTDNTYKM